MTKSVWGKKWLGGYPGLKFTADKIIQYIPECKIYVEPFAGLARTAKGVKCQEMILNDMSDFSNEYCKTEFPNARVTHEDFRECIKKYKDNPDVFMLIDPPWRDNIYSENDKAYSNMKVESYYANIFYLLGDAKCEWIVCTNEHSVGYRFFRRNILRIEADGSPIFGKKTHVVLTSKNPLTLNTKCNYCYLGCLNERFCSCDCHLTDGVRSS